MKGKGISGGLVPDRPKHRLHRLHAEAEFNFFFGKQAKNGAPTSTESMQGVARLEETTTPTRSECVGDAVSMEEVQ